MKIALAQMQMQEKPKINLEKTLSLIRQEAAEDSCLIFFPEFQLSPFFPQHEKRAVQKYLVSLDHEYIREICDACAKYHIMASPNVYLQEQGKSYDASLMIDASGKITGVSKMVHIMQSRFFYEQDYYSPSEDGFKVYDTLFGKIGVVICFDRHLPESIRTCTSMGADLILIPTANTVDEPLDIFEWEMRIQAMQISVFIAMCNRVGKEEAMEFIGQSLIIDPEGTVIGKAGSREELH